MKLRELAHARAGDKGDVSNIALIAYDRADYPRLAAVVTAQRVQAHFGGAVTGPVVRYDLPQLAAFNFVMQGALGGGVTRSLALDPHGKSFSALLLEMEIPD